MSMDFRSLSAGFGGQGILFSGKFLAYVGMIIGKEVSWQPSYGPEMRGGTANCGVIISDTPIGSPIVTKPNVLIIMNLPSLDKFENSVTPGGKIFVDSSLVNRKVARGDVDTYYIPATQMASDMGSRGSANMILIGKVLKETGLCSEADIHKAMTKTVPESKKALFDINMQAVKLGYEF